ncbi:hypothetical protein STEG23_021154 [Scotinomys teguina]
MLLNPERIWFGTVTSLNRTTLLPKRGAEAVVEHNFLILCIKGVSGIQQTNRSCPPVTSQEQWTPVCVSWKLFSGCLWRKKSYWDYRDFFQQCRGGPGAKVPLSENFGRYSMFLAASTS